MELSQSEKEHRQASAGRGRNCPLDRLSWNPHILGEMVRCPAYHLHKSQFNREMLLRLKSVIRIMRDASRRRVLQAHTPCLRSCCHDHNVCDAVRPAVTACKVPPDEVVIAS